MCKDWQVWRIIPSCASHSHIVFYVGYVMDYSFSGTGQTQMGQRHRWPVHVKMRCGWIPSPQVMKLTPLTTHRRSWYLNLQVTCCQVTVLTDVRLGKSTCTWYTSGCIWQAASEPETSSQKFHTQIINTWQHQILMLGWTTHVVPSLLVDIKWGVYLYTHQQKHLKHSL